MRGGGGSGSGGLAGELVAAVAAENVLPALAAGDYEHLPVAAFKLIAAERGKLVGAEVLVHGLVVADTLGLIYRLAADDERADAELLRGGLVRRLAEHGLAKHRQRRGKNIADVRHGYLLMIRNYAVVCDSRIDKLCPNGTAQRPSPTKRLIVRTLIYLPPPLPHSNIRLRFSAAAFSSFLLYELFGSARTAATASRPLTPPDIIASTSIASALTVCSTFVN